MANRRLFVAIRYHKSETGICFIKSKVQVCKNLNVIPDRLIFDTVANDNGKEKIFIREYLNKNESLNIFFSWLSYIPGCPQWFIGKYHEKQAKHSSLVIAHMSYCNNYLSLFYFYNYEHPKLKDRITYTKSIIQILANLVALK